MTSQPQAHWSIINTSCNGKPEIGHLWNIIENRLLLKILCLCKNLITYHSNSEYNFLFLWNYISRSVAFQFILLVDNSITTPSFRDSSYSETFQQPVNWLWNCWGVKLSLPLCLLVTTVKCNKQTNTNKKPKNPPKPKKTKTVFTALQLCFCLLRAWCLCVW